MKWQGRCPACGAWNSIEEHVEKAMPAARKAAAAPGPAAGRRLPKKLQEIEMTDEIRFTTGMGELDRVLGGGAVVGSLVLWAVPPVSENPHCCCRSAVISAAGERSSISLARKVRASSNCVPGDCGWKRKIF